MARLKMCETVSAGAKFVEQGHVRVGPEVITDPAYLVPRFVRRRNGVDGRNLEDFVTWVDSSKIKRNIMKYSDKVWGLGGWANISLMTLICCSGEMIPVGNWVVLSHGMMWEIFFTALLPFKSLRLDV
jgi:S4 domain